MRRDRFADAGRELATLVCQGPADFTAELTDMVADLTGAPPRSLGQFAQTHFGSR